MKLNFFKKDTKKTEAEQIMLNIKANKRNPIANLNAMLSRMELRLEVMPFWKNFSFVFMLVSSILFPSIILLIMILNFSDLPSELGLFYDPNHQSAVNMDVGVILIIPIVYGVVNVILVNILYNVFNFDRRLAQIIAITTNIANVLFIIAFSQILSIFLV